MSTFTFEETNLLCIYNTGSRTGLIESLTDMQQELAPDEHQLRSLTESVLNKLRNMTDDDFQQLELYPHYGE